MEIFTPEVTNILITAATVLVMNAVQAIAKRIPDNATGWKGFVRNAINTITSYVVNNTGKESSKPSPQRAVVFPDPGGPGEKGDGGG